ncbi:hypothetical protein [Pedobacter faecalis]|uniref:hypothetical protein n=1 Tax=Pedobacter faecalis TaxID=3041495 RepID=UPI00254F5D5B|nr:hypothetical protein [Pedobacter sp. ELA7]
MKALFCSLLILTCLAVSTTTAQDRSNQDNPEATIFGLLPKKHKYDDVMSRTRTNSAEERKKLAALEYSLFEYESDELLELYLIPGVKMKYPSRDQ